MTSPYKPPSAQSPENDQERAQLQREYEAWCRGFRVGGGCLAAVLVSALVALLLIFALLVISSR